MRTIVVYTVAIISLVVAYFIGPMALAITTIVVVVGGAIANSIIMLKDNHRYISRTKELYGSHPAIDKYLEKYR